MSDPSPRSAPRLFLMCGLPGAGKTTRAKQLEEEHHAVRLTPDEWITAILQPGWTRDDLDRLRDPIESLQWSTAERLLELGVNVVIDWGLWGRDERDRLRERAKRFGARVEVHFINPSREVLVERLAQRRQGAKDSSFFVSEEELDLWAGWLQPPTSEELEIGRVSRPSSRSG